MLQFLRKYRLWVFASASVPRAGGCAGSGTGSVERAFVDGAGGTNGQGAILSPGATPYAGRAAGDGLHSCLSTR